jgi:ankyrin repeat protein
MTNFVTICEGNALHWACMGGRLEIVHILCSFRGIDVNSPVEKIENATPLEIARTNGHFEIVKFLKEFQKIMNSY